MHLNEKERDGNFHVLEFINYYKNLPVSPGYAILLTGPWGIGKTFLVKELLQTELGDRSAVYISLYGVSTADDLDQAIAFSLYPIASWKGTRFLGKLIKSGVSALGAEIDLKATDVIADPRNKLLIFDDLERCELSTKVVFGRINEFLEHRGCKAIVIANEVEIPDQENYSKAKEKIIGKGFKVQTEFKSAFSEFLKDCSSAETRSHLVQHQSEIEQLFKQSQLDNLRLLKRAMMDLARVFDSQNDEQRQSSELQLHLVRLVLPFSFEIGAGQVPLADLLPRPDEMVRILGKADGSSESNFDRISKKYPECDLFDQLLPDKFLINLLMHGHIDKSELSDILNRSRFFLKPVPEECWRLVWHAWSLPEETVENAYLVMEQQFAERSFLRPGAMLHVFGLQLWLSDISI
jgi:hypothetical protein